MAMKRMSSLICLFILLQLLISSVSANLMLAPQRVVFGERDRSASVSLINTSNKTTTYRLHWVQKKQTINGDYIDLPSDSNDVPSAAPMLRFSPRQVTLAPGEKQTVRIALRRKQGLTHGEYRSHLLFQALPQENENIQSGSGAHIKINLLLGFAIPVIVRQGKLQAQAKINRVEITKTIENGKAFYGARIAVQRSGPHTAYGTLKVHWKSRLNQNYKQVGILNNVALYPENNVIQYHAGLKDFNPTNGQIKVEYIGRKEFEGKEFDIMETRINSRDFKLEQRD